MLVIGRRLPQTWNLRASAIKKQIYQTDADPFGTQRNADGGVIVGGLSLRKIARQLPVKRADFSDRTAWIMAILAQLLCEEFDEEKDQLIPNLALELAKLTDQEEIEERLRKLQKTLAKFYQSGTTQKDKNKALQATLAVGGFELAGAGVIHNEESSTRISGSSSACLPGKDCFGLSN